MGVLALVLAALATPQEAAPSLERDVRALLEPLYPPGEPGAVVLVARGGEVLVHASFGSADLEREVPMRPDAVFELASVTKVLTATAVLALVDDGRLALDDTVAELLEPCPAAWKGITVEQLLAHTAGLPDLLERADLATWMRRQVTLDELVASFADRPLAFAPGTGQAYSNSNYAVLAALVERAAGRPWPKALRERVLEPAGMGGARVGVDDELVPGRALGYTRDGAGGFRNATFYSLSILRGSGDVLASATDLHRFLVALDGGELLERGTLRAMLEPARLSDGRVTARGLGWELNRVEGRPLALVGGALSGYCHYVGYLPRDAAWVVLLTNRGPEEEHRPGRLVLELAGLLLRSR